MTFSRFVLPSLAVIVFACTASVASAQPGPVGGNKQGGNKQGGNTQAKSGKLTPERVATLLKSKVQANQDGSKAIVANVTKDGWQFDIVIVFLADGKVFDIYSPLTGANPNFTEAQIQGMEEKNKELKAAQKAFMLNNQDNRLYFANINFLVTMNDQTFLQELDAHCAVIRESYDLWKQQ